MSKGRFRVTVVDIDIDDLSEEEKSDIANLMARDELAEQAFASTGNPDCLRVTEEAFETFINKIIKNHDEEK